MTPLKVSLIQTYLSWEDPSANCKHFRSYIDQLDQPQLVVLPEMFTTGFSMLPEGVAESAVDGFGLEWMKTTATEKGIHLMGSIAVEEGGKYYNRLYHVSPEAEVTHYDKRHLFRMGGEDEHYHEGDSRVIVNINGWRICLQVCYDLRFPVFARNRQDYDVLVYVANWPTPRKNAWNILLHARAIENQCYVVGVNRIGDDKNGLLFEGGSLIIDPKGHDLARLDNEDTTATAELTMEPLQQFREQFPVGKDADDFTLNL